MKRPFLFAALFLFVSVLHGQVNYSGSYGYSMAPDDKSVSKENTAIPGGRVVLIKMDENKYRFWLDVLTGPPGYNRGETDGVISFLNDTASFDNTFEDATNPCILKFRISGKTIHVNSLSSSFNCGFGNGVSADGDYTWLKTQEILNNDWLRKQYPHSPVLKIAASKAELYKDENGLQSFSTKKYLSKGDSFSNVAETDKTVYTEFIGTDGSLQYGWIRKTDIKMKD